MRGYLGMLAAGGALATALMGCGGSVPGLGGSDGVLLPGNVFGASRTSASRSRESRPISPWDLKAVRSHPPNPSFSSERTESAGNSAVRVREVTFEAEPVPGKSLSLFAYYVTPAQTGRGRGPALVLISDRTTAASEEQASAWAACGYAALALDLPGKGAGREPMRSSGPDWTDKALASASPAANPLHASVAAVIAAVSLLAGQPEVDAHRIGLLGEGWGGVVAALAGTVDGRPRALVLARTAGDLNRGSLAEALKTLSPQEREAWTRAYTPDAYAKASHPATLFVQPLSAADPPLSAVTASFRGWAGVKTLALIPPDATGGETATEEAWLGARLRGETPLPEIHSLQVEGDRVLIRTTGAAPPRSVGVFYTTSDFSKAEWGSLVCQKVSDQEWHGGLPKSEGTQPIVLFAAITDVHGAVVCNEPITLTGGRPAARGESVTASAAQG